MGLRKGESSKSSGLAGTKGVPVSGTSVTFRRARNVVGVAFLLVSALLLLAACTPPTKAESPALRHATREADRLGRGNEAKPPAPVRVETRQAARADRTPKPSPTRSGIGPAREATRLVQEVALTPSPPAEGTGTPAPAGKMTPVPSAPKAARGVFAITQPNTPFVAETFSNPVIDGIVVRTYWQDVEPTPGNFNWTFIDSQLNNAADHGKKVILIVQPGAYTPSWALADVATAAFDSKYGIIKGQELHLPLPWDQTYLYR